MELQVNELKFGNLVNHISFGDIFIYGVNKDCIQCDFDNSTYYDDLEYYKPIPITEEWLIKFGFKRTSSNGSGFISNKLRIEKRIDTNNAFQVWWNSWYLVDVTEIHNLQNLYFSLTGRRTNY